MINIQIDRILLVSITGKACRSIKTLLKNSLPMAVSILCVCLLTGCATQNSSQINSQNTLVNNERLFANVLGNASENTPFMLESTPFGDFATITVTPIYTSALGALCRQANIGVDKQIRIVATCQGDNVSSELIEWQLLSPISGTTIEEGNNDH